MGVVRAATLYFVTVYSAGFVLGSLREVLLVPALGSFSATAIEAPAMLAVCFAAARWITRRPVRPYTLRQRLALGAIAFGLLMLAEMVFAYALRGLTFTMWVAEFATPQGALSGALFGAFAILPALVGPGRNMGVP